MQKRIQLPTASPQKVERPETLAERPGKLKTMKIISGWLGGVAHKWTPHASQASPSPRTNSPSYWVYRLATAGRPHVPSFVVMPGRSVSNRLSPCLPGSPAFRFCLRFGFIFVLCYFCCLTTMTTTCQLFNAGSRSRRAYASHNTSTLQTQAGYHIYTSPEIHIYPAARIVPSVNCRLIHK